MLRDGAETTRDDIRTRRTLLSQALGEIAEAFIALSIKLLSAISHQSQDGSKGIDGHGSSIPAREQIGCESGPNIMQDHRVV